MYEKKRPGIMFVAIGAIGGAVVPLFLKPHFPDIGAHLLSGYENVQFQRDQGAYGSTLSVGTFYQIPPIG